MEDEVKRSIRDLFPMDIIPLEDGIKYLGYIIKPNKYSRDDWIWLLKKVEKYWGSVVIDGSPLGGNSPLSKRFWKTILSIGCPWKKYLN